MSLMESADQAFQHGPKTPRPEAERLESAYRLSTASCLAPRETMVHVPTAPLHVGWSMEQKTFY
jgi:hypothetical protein